MAESNQRTARAQKASKAQKAQSGAAKAKARQEEEALLRADTFTNAPKVSRRTLTKEEREALAKQREAETKEAEKIASAWSKGGLGRWWARLQSSPDKVTWGMAIVALGVVYGDIGTSPLYTAQTFLAGQGGLGSVDREAVLGMLSLVFWSITLITTVKYVLIAMRIDNNGEGGIFALYSLIRKYGAWLAIPAMLGGAAFLADSVLTPAVSISSAVEGLQTLPPLEGLFDENPSLTLMITVVIIVILFSVQSRGTESIGKVFGSMVLVWFGFLAIVGVTNLSNDWSVFEALNPVYGIKFLFSPHNAAGIALMGTVFLSTTGAEALYSDMGHVGRGNIYFTWPFIKVALVLNYFGQGAWMLANSDNPQYTATESLNPFFQMMSPNVRYLAVILSVSGRRDRFPGPDYRRVHHGLRSHPPQLDASSAGAVPGPHAWPAVHSGGQRRAVRLHAGRTRHLQGFGTHLCRIWTGVDHYDDHHHRVARRLPMAFRQAGRCHRVHRAVLGDSGYVLHRVYGQIPAWWLVHHVADRRDSVRHVHVE